MLGKPYLDSIMDDFPEDLHWRMIVSNLRKKGMSYSHIAQETGFSVADLRQMESETYYPPFISIIKLLDLHLTKCPEQHMKIGVRYPEEAEC